MLNNGYFAVYNLTNMMLIIRINKSLYIITVRNWRCVYRALFSFIETNLVIDPKTELHYTYICLSIHSYCKVERDRGIFGSIILNLE